MHEKGDGKIDGKIFGCEENMQITNERDRRQHVAATDNDNDGIINCHTKVTY